MSSILTTLKNAFNRSIMSQDERNIYAGIINIIQGTSLEMHIRNKYVNFFGKRDGYDLLLKINIIKDGCTEEIGRDYEYLIKNCYHDGDHKNDIGEVLNDIYQIVSDINYKTMEK